MQLSSITSSLARRRYIDFIYRVYRGCPYFKDTLISIVRTFLEQSDRFTRAAHIRPLVVTEGGETVAQCMLIAAPQLPVLQIGFFEALPGQAAAVDLLLREAFAECRKLGLHKIVIGLNGHVSYGVGLLTDRFDEPISFDSLYSYPYYPVYFEGRGFSKQTLTSYTFEMDRLHIAPTLAERAKKHFHFRAMDMRRFHEEMRLFGDLCNRCLRSTYLYFERDPECLYELLLPLRSFLKPEHLIFAYHEDEPVGFIFWHPDYNEIMPGGRAVPIWEMGLRYLIFAGRITTMKINAIGVLPAYQQTSATAGLIAETYRYAHARYRRGETNFVWDNNQPSTLLNRRIMHLEYRHYCVFEIAMDETNG